jgi:ArsR family transcriptional regulator
MTTEEIGGRFKALGDVTRLRILALLSEREYCNCELVDIFGISQPAISRHMARLREAKLVREQRRGQWIDYSLNQDALHDPDGLFALLARVRQDDPLVSEVSGRGAAACAITVKT